jgi:hypothetical protein
VEYQFKSPERKTVKNQLEMRRNDLRGKVLPSPGTPMAILYVNADNYEVL